MYSTVSKCYIFVPVCRGLLKLMFIVSVVMQYGFLFFIYSLFVNLYMLFFVCVNVHVSMFVYFHFPTVMNVV